MDFERAFASGSLESSCGAALFLRAKGRDGAAHLSALLDRCQSVAIDNLSLSVFQERLVCYGARSLGAIVHEMGYEADNQLHERVKDWLVRLTTNRHIQIAGFAIYSLGDLGIPPLDVQRKLEELIVAPKRTDELPTITCRGTAFRVLAALDRSLASRFVDSPAAKEYSHAVERWLEDGADDAALHADLRWLRSA